MGGNAAVSALERSSSRRPGKRIRRPPIPTHNSVTDLIRNKNSGCLEHWERMFPMSKRHEFQMGPWSQGGDLNAEQINQVDISRYSSRRVLCDLIGRRCGLAFAADYAPVTAARLANPEPGNWLMIRGNYKGWRNSSLDQINTRNVRSWCRCGVSRPGWYFGSRIAADRQQRSYVHHDAVQPSDRARCG